MPTNTDLVTDLPADFEVFGQAVATSMADLLGGTTGQILSKATNADMDFTWIANDQGDITGVTATSPLTGGGTSGAITVGIQASSTTQSGAVQLTDSTSSTSTTTAATPNSVKTSYDLAAAAVPKSTVTTAGDVIYATGSGAVTRLGIGTAGQVLTVNGGATAPSWTTPAGGGGGKVLQVVGATYSTTTTTASTTYADTGLTATITPTSATSKIMVLVSQSISIETSSSAADVGGAVRLMRGATGIFNNAADYQTAYWTGSSGTFYIVNYTNIMYLDSPATTSATTYKTQQRAYDTAAGEKIASQVASATSTITLLEIGDRKSVV
jgi:hypothetical protein